MQHAVDLLQGRRRTAQLADLLHVIVCRANAGVLTVSQPRLSQQNSKQSLAASQDYYSLSDSASDHSPSGNDKSRHAALRYSTPPSRVRSPEDDDVLLADKETGEVKQPRHSRTQESLTIPPGVRFDQTPRELKRKPVPSTEFDEKKQSLAMDPSRSPVTTPGVDDTPYIRFAIDQLTRDEEIRGTRQYAPPTSGLPTTGRGHIRQPTGTSSRYSRPTEPPTPQQARQESPEDYQVQTGIYDDGLGYMEQQKAASAGRGYPAAPAAVPARHPDHTAARRSTPSVGDGVPPPAPGSPDLFIPYRPPHNSPAFPPLRFIPGILRPVSLSIYIFLVLLMLVGLLFCAIYPLTHDGIWTYRAFGDGRYFVFQYLPIIFGMILLLWLFEIQTALTRIAPFVALASASTRSRSNAVFLTLSPKEFLLPRIEYFRAGQPLLGGCFVIFWLFLFTIPLLASAFNTQFYGSAASGDYYWVAVQGVIWTIVVLYILLLAALIIILVTLRRAITGLKWDPRSLADYIALLERSNIMADYSGTETFTDLREFRQRLWNRTDRLGYWNTTRRPQDVFYGIGEEGGATRVYSIEAGRIKEKVSPPSRGGQAPASGDIDLETGDERHNSNGDHGAFSIRADIRSSRTRRRYLPWLLKDGPLIAWTLTIAVLYIAFLVVSFVNDALHNGFSPSLGAGSNTAGFSAANFLYSFIPTLIALLLFLLWQPFDLAFRRLEPFANLSKPDGAVAEHSLLLDYTSSLPIVVTLKALFNRHWQVAYLSAVTLLNTTIPILASGMFWAQYYPSTSSVRVAASPPALYALCFFLAVYVVSTAALFAGRRRRALPHAADNLAQVISWLYMSRLVGDAAFARCRSKIELVTRLVVSAHNPASPGESRLPMREAGFMASAASLLGARKPPSPTRAEEKTGASGEKDGMRRVAVPGEVRYGFGVYVGRDGREHLGVDRVRREGVPEMVLFGKGRRGGR